MAMAQVTREERGDSVSHDRAETAFIVGPARSGTTLLYKALCLHPQVAFISNWRSRFAWLPATAALNRVARRAPSLERAIWFRGSDAYAYGRARRFRDRLFPSPVEGEPVYTRAGVVRPGGPAAGAIDPSVALPAAFDSIRALGSGTCLVSKRIANNLRIPQLHDIFPRARFVVLVRDGRAVAESLSRVDWWETDHVWWYGGTPSQWRAEGGDPWEICARNWTEEINAIERGLQAVPSDQVMSLRYEDVVADPQTALESLAGFIGLANDRDWRTSVGSVPIRDHNEGWKSRLDPDVVERITTFQRPELRRFGYVD
ncbi:MAG: sulfotransferase family protein [Actinomycetota bacterium]